MKNPRFSRFETIARRLVEGSFARLFGRPLEQEIATKLAHAVEDSQQNGRLADDYLIQLHPADLVTVQAQNAGLAGELVSYIHQLAKQSGLRLAQSPSVVLKANAALRRQTVQVEATHTPQLLLEETAVSSREQINKAVAQAVQQKDAFLVLNGRSHVMLNKPVMNIGRLPENDIVIDLPTVSRKHAQLRWRYGRFILYDLSRRGRTKVNGRRVKEHLLQSGDVISLSDVLLIYNEGHAQATPRSASRETADQITLIKPPRRDES